MNKKQQSNVDAFLQSTDSIKSRTSQEYNQIINDFIQFSPESKLDDYFNYLKFKSGCSFDTNKENFIVWGTLIKHANNIKRYLFSVHNQYPWVSIESKLYSPRGCRDYIILLISK